MSLQRLARTMSRPRCARTMSVAAAAVEGKLGRLALIQLDGTAVLLW